MTAKGRKKLPKEEIGLTLDLKSGSMTVEKNPVLGEFCPFWDPLGPKLPGGHGFPAERSAERTFSGVKNIRRDWCLALWESSEKYVNIG